jgi:PKD repeat protein
MVASFTDQSTGVVNGWSWDFGDGGTSTDQNPTHTYTAHGAYTVTLTVTGPGGSDTETQTVTINPPPPVASFTAQPVSGTIPLTVTFTSTSTGIIDTVAWDLDADGVFDDATGPTATRTFDIAGDHTVGLSVTGPGGSSTTSQTVVANLPPPPVASFTAMPSAGTAPVTVNFNDTSTGVITSRSWDFDGDGVTDDTGATPSHIFSSPGVFQVYLTVTGPGGSSTTSQTLTVATPPPEASFTAAPTSGTAPLTVQFTNTSTGDITSLVWDAGDGDTTTVTDPSSFSLPVQATYEIPGTYTATLTATGPGGSDTATQVITVSAPPPAAPDASFIASPQTGTAPLLVNFVDTSTGSITSWSWDFGDQSSTTAQNPSHTYTDAGTFVVRLTVTGPGGSDTFSRGILVSAPGGGDPGCNPRCVEPPPDDGPPSGLP